MEDDVIPITINRHSCVWDNSAVTPFVRRSVAAAIIVRCLFVLGDIVGLSLLIDGFSSSLGSCYLHLMVQSRHWHVHIAKEPPYTARYELHFDYSLSIPFRA